MKQQQQQQQQQAWRRLYSLLQLLLIPVIFLRLWWKGRLNFGYRQRWLERLALLPLPNNFKNGIWFHLASVGETVAATPTINAVLARYPHVPVIVTTTTPTGADQVHRTFKHRVFHQYLPLDIPGAMQRLIHQLQPSCLLLFETELWPNLLHYCHQNRVPSWLINGRLSNRSVKGYEKVSFLSKSMLNCLDYLLVQTERDETNFIRLGVDGRFIQVTGSVKLDKFVDSHMQNRCRELRRQLQAHNRPVWIAASTHHREEEIILAAFQKILEEVPNALLVLVPRHQERFVQVKVCVEQSGLAFYSLSQGLSLPEEPIKPYRPAQFATKVILADIMGKLNELYGIADVAFIGNSLMPPGGGHNFIEPAAHCLPLLSGSHYINFLEIGDAFKQVGALQEVTEDTLADSVIRLLQDPSLRSKMGMAAFQVVKANRGAQEKVYQFLFHQLDKKYQQSFSDEN